jgi:hypothetical protein
MGRYAEFNTGFEYKFSFGIQDSSDMQYFGGEVNDTDDVFYNTYYSGHVWSERDKEMILSILNRFGEGFILPDFSKYERTLDGTYKLYGSNFYKLNDLERCGDKKLYKKIAKFMLGCLIYHQLLYVDKLYVTYEL